MSHQNQPSLRIMDIRNLFHLIISIALKVSLLLTLIVCQALNAESTKPELLLAKTYAQQIDIKQYWVSEKFDGVRAYWDGAQFISRQGNVYSAPDWFTRGFPKRSLDGELWIARGAFEALVSAVRKSLPIDEEWRRVKYMVFELPNARGTFSQRLEKLAVLIDAAQSEQLKIVPQFKLANHTELMAKLDEITQAGAEGLMLHHQDALYHTGRSSDLLKVKRHEDAEAIVIAHLPGKGKYTGLLGALVVQTTDGKRFKIGSGFSDKQRKSPPPIGVQITYKYFGKTKNGIPRFASFMRIRKRGSNQE
ncbi:MAG: DNA ligase [Arenicellales bacterium]